MATTAAVARAFHALFLALWVGAGALYLIVVIPEATTLLPGPEARRVLAAVLSDLDLYGLFAGPVVVLTLFAGWSMVGARIRLRTLGALAMIGGTIASGRWLTPRVIELEAALGHPLEQSAPGDPLRAQIEQLLVASDATVTAVVIIGLLMMIGATRSPTLKRPTGILV